MAPYLLLVMLVAILLYLAVAAIKSQAGEEEEDESIASWLVSIDNDGKFTFENYPLYKEEAERIALGLLTNEELTDEAASYAAFALYSRNDITPQTKVSVHLQIDGNTWSASGEGNLRHFNFTPYYEHGSLVGVEDLTDAKA